MSKYIKLLILCSLSSMILFAGCVGTADGTNNNENHEISLNITDNTVMLEFYADWCGYCKALEPTIKDLENEGIEVIKIDTDKNQNLANQYGVRALPTIVYIKDGKIVDKTIGYKPEEIKEKAKKIYNN
ncbi:Thioredoxin domain [Methanococcus aeolicus Nankai-3]|uniref:Thioredoxin domain n=1 Tax=Methanococcus aeolicus (strain ATCC BAA-1280 / DSM 17508 / OCM 812 / Nankai-3) TaxID=419665 RepID=A6UUK2_META3|nr:thioredoxin family protein [Methanococcus aeolicus]ABR56174.1 Thioredoxin domain [Methanococcus aeolicus Nankai-3]